MIRMKAEWGGRKVERGGRDRMGEGDLKLGKFQRIMG